MQSLLFDKIHLFLNVMYIYYFWSNLFDYAMKSDL